MKKTLLFLFMFTLLFSSSVFAHVANEKTLYDDIEFSQAKEQIVYLRGLDAIAYEQGAELFKPQEKLTKADLAFWVSTFKGLGGPDAKKEDLQKEAVQNGLIDSLEGNATYADVNQAYFDGKASVEKPEGELTREEFALFMGQFLKEKVDGKTLFEMAGFEPGPAGIVEKVTSEMEGEGEKAYKIFRFMINGKEYQVSSHPKILYGPVDLSVWEGKKIGESWLAGGHGDEKVVQIIVVDQGQFADDEIAEQSPDPSTGNSDQSQGQGSPSDKAGEGQASDVAEQSGGFPVVPVIGGIVLVGIVGWLMMRENEADMK
jgi:hypothetical protein